jgi:hypothetical protein
MTVKTVFAPDFKTLDTAFAANPVSEVTKKSLDEIRIELAPDADKPTTASAKPGQKDLQTVQLQIDPNGLSAVFPGAAIQLSSVNSLVGSTTQSTRNETLYLALADALRILINDFSYEEVIVRIDSIFGNGGVNILSSNIKDVVRKGIAEIIKDVSVYGPDNIPEPEYYVLVENDFVNIPEKVVTVPPQLYKQQYFLYKNDLFPGYEEWRSEEEVVFIKRKIGDYYFESMQEDISGTSSLEISSFLSPYIANPQTVLTVKMFDDMMIQQENNIKKNGMDKALGAGSGGGGLSSVLSQLLGQLSVTINLQAEAQLPDSVLNAQAVNKSMEAFSESMAIVNRVNQMIDQAFIVPSVLDDLKNINLDRLTSSNVSESTSTATQRLSFAIG